MKKIFNITITIFLIFFSFYYTNKVSDYIKNNDPIMIKLNNIKKQYEKEPINAIITNNTIIPGISGSSVNIEKSYIKMKKINKFQESMLVFNKIKPSISISDNYDKYILSGNPQNNNISLLLKINDLNILKEFTNENINFILNSSFIENNLEYLKNISNNIIIYQSNITNNLNLIDYCYETNINNSNVCNLYQKFTVIPNIINHNYYYNTYLHLQNGKIFAYNITNQNNVNEINLLIKGIINLGYEIVKLDDLLKE